MNFRYSKPLGDIRPESSARLESDTGSRSRQAAVSAGLRDGPDRPRCLLCTGELARSPVFEHRGIPFRHCSGCGHIQSRIEPPAGYPGCVPGGPTFAEIYPELSPEALRSRIERVYRPKLDWVLEIARTELLPVDPLGARWVEVGCGAGTFLSCLQQAGVEGPVGLEADPRLVQRAQQLVGMAQVRSVEGTLAAALDGIEADLFASFFVFEHLPDLHDVLKAFSRKPEGTVLVFAVPVFGVAALLENSFGDHFARSLDSVVHTQIFTESSLEHALGIAGLEPVATWVFGQDADDLVRVLTLKARQNLPAELGGTVIAALGAWIDALQQSVDRSSLADARHVIAIRKDGRSR